MNIQPLVACALLGTFTGFGALSVLLLDDPSEGSRATALMPTGEATPPAMSLPPALQDLLGERRPACDPTQGKAQAMVQELAHSLEAPKDRAHSTSERCYSWKQLGSGLDRRFAAMTDVERRADIAFVHFLVRNGIEPESLTDHALAGAFDDLAELFVQRDRELRTIQFQDTGSGTLEQIHGEEVDDRSLEVMERYRELEQQLGGRYGGTDQRLAGAATLASSASAR